MFYSRTAFEVKDRFSSGANENLFSASMAGSCGLSRTFTAHGCEELMGHLGFESF